MDHNSGVSIETTPPFVRDRTGIATAPRVVVKIGSSSLTNPDGTLATEMIDHLVGVIAERHARGQQVVLVTSGAIAAGFAPMGLATRPRDLATAQAAASVGQGILITYYQEAFAQHGVQVGQVLLTADDTMRRGHYANARRALERLLALGIVPIINENDAVATDEIRFGDNDRLAALVSHIVRADALVLLTDVDGLYDGPPAAPSTSRIPVVRKFSEISAVEVSSKGSAVGTGGMASKLESVRIATATGIPVVLTSASQVAQALAGEDVGTWFAIMGKRMRRRRLWLAYAAKTEGKLLLDAGATKAVLGGRASLLAAGVTDFSGNFDAGDPVELVSPEGLSIARGLVAFDSHYLPEILGQRTSQLRNDLGSGFDRPVVHRDDLVLAIRPKKVQV